MTYENQIKAATDIINLFLTIPFVVLLAQPQSGKTGTYLRIAFQMIHQNILDPAAKPIKRVIILCGSSDKSLRKQTRDDMNDHRKQFLEEIDPNEEMSRGHLKLFDNIEVRFSQDLRPKKSDKTPFLPVDSDTLIIHDESHMAQSKDNRPFIDFYHRNNLNDSLYGDFSELRKRNIYILNVSATPFSEIIANKKIREEDWNLDEQKHLEGKVVEPKEIYFAEPGDGYIGVCDFLDKKKIFFESSQIKAENCQHIAKVLNEGKQKYKQKYCLIRTHRAEKDSDMLQALSTAAGFRYQSFFGDNKDGLEILKKKPEEPTVIHICARFRMGQVLHKEHVGMVYEQSKNPKADTILQGLPGRVFGYGSTFTNTDIDVYVSKAAEKHFKNYAEAWKIAMDDTDQNATIELSKIDDALNLKPPSNKNGGDIIPGLNMDGDTIDWIKTVPIPFMINEVILPGESSISFSRSIFKGDNGFERIRNLLEEKKERNPEFPDIDLMIKNLENMCAAGTISRSTPKVNVHDSKGDKSKSYNTGLHYGNFQSACMNEGRLNVSPACPKGSAIWLNPFSIIGEIGPEKKCFLQGFVPYNPIIHPAERDENPSINPKCNYVPGNIQLEDNSFLQDVNGGQIIRFTVETTDDPDSFESELSAMIQRTIPELDTYIPEATRKITSLYDSACMGYEGIRLDKSYYTQETLDEIGESLSRRFDVKVKFNKSRGRQPKEYFKFSSIEW